MVEKKVAEKVGAADAEGDSVKTTQGSRDTLNFIMVTWRFQIVTRVAWKKKVSRNKEVEKTTRVLKINSKEWEDRVYMF